MKYIIELPQKESTVSPDLKFKGRNLKSGEFLGVTKDYFTKNGQPWFPIMGEFHFSRYPEEYWEEEILKMKAGGIEIIANYVFWIYHEEVEGNFIWEGQRNLRRFVEVCQKCGVFMFLRIGPWSHGECRNGGFPDWLLAKGFELRSDNPNYLAKVNKVYRQIYQQVEGLFFKDDGPIIGIQIENEYGHAGGFDGEKGEAHMRTLTGMAKEIGFDVPYYTATGWGGAVIGDNLPVMGAYVDAPWADSAEQLPLNDNFIFSDDRNDNGIGSDYIDSVTGPKKFSFDPSGYPYATAELGGGLMVTKDRRPVASGKDTEVMVFTRVASGANLVGYYMYHGGTNLVGKLSTFNESKKTGSPCDLPILSYDFQGVIGEYGQTHESFDFLRLQHLFLVDFGREVATSSVFFPEFNASNPENFEQLRVSVRHSQDSGFVFLNNYQRHADLPDRNDIELQIDLGDTQIKFPKFTLKNGQNIVLPFNLNVNGTVIEYATSQPLCLLNDDNIVFWNYTGGCEYKIGGKIYKGQTGTELNLCNLNIKTLTREEAQKAWKINREGKEVLIFNEALLIENGKVYTEISSKPHTAKATFKEIKTSENGDKFFKIILPELFQDGERDVYLTIDFEGSLANLFMDGKLVADWFYTGLPWNVGLKRFRNDLSGKELTLQVKPLKKDAPIYVEIPPKYVKGIACNLFSVSLISEFEKNI